MAEETDGIEEALQAAVRLAVTAGARLGSEIARAREDRLREQRRVDERDAGRLAQRFDAEKRAAVAELAQVHRADWWERADPQRIGQTYATARAWAPETDEAARAERTMRAELLQRYGVDPDRADPRGRSGRGRRVAATAGTAAPPAGRSRTQRGGRRTGRSGGAAGPGSPRRPPGRPRPRGRAPSRRRAGPEPVAHRRPAAAGAPPQRRRPAPAGTGGRAAV